MVKIQVVEDDRALREGICLTLQETSLEFIQSGSVEKARIDYEREKPDIIILDVNLPDGSGYEYLREVKKRGDSLVLILTANDMETDEVMSLTLGADDYMSKPFSLAVLRARIIRFLDRLEKKEERQNPRRRSAVYEEDDFRFDFDRMEFTKQGEEIALSVNEQKLLRLFMENRGNLLTRNVLVDRLWSDGGEYVDENALSVTVNRLRGKLEEKKSGKTYIQTIYGQGYQWKPRSREENKS